MGDPVNPSGGNFFKFLLKTPQHIGQFHEASQRTLEASQQAEETLKEAGVKPTADALTVETPKAANPASTVPLVDETPNTTVESPEQFNFLKFMDEN